MSQPDPLGQPVGSEELLGKVNSLYGPGTVVGWYLTIIAILISWVLHPEKRKSDFLAVDLIAVLTFPSVALGHLFSLMRHQQSWRIEKVAGSPHWNKSLRPELFAAYAPFILIRAFLPISILLLIGAVPTSCCERGWLVVSLAFTCANVLLMFEHMFDLSSAGPVYHDGDYIKIYWLLYLLLTNLGFCSLLYLIVLFIAAFVRPDSDDNKASQNDTKSQVPSPPRESIHVVHTIHPMIYVIVMFIYAKPDLVSGQNPETHRPKVLAFIYLESNSLLKDLDQAVAAFAGATVLLFNLYSVVTAWYKDRIQRRVHQTGHRSNERTQLRPLKKQSGVLPLREARHSHYTDFELEPIRSSTSTQIRDHEQMPKTKLSALERFPHCSGALTDVVADAEEPDAPLPMGTGQNQRPRPPLHVHFAEETSIIQV